jgi:hypothetical protein
VFTKDGIHTLVDVVIVDPTQANLIHQSYTTRRFATFEVVQAKKGNYYDRHPIGQFLPLAIEVFGCLNKQANVFLHDCANAMWNFKRPKCTPLSVLVIFHIKNSQLHCKGCKHPPS